MKYLTFLFLIFSCVSFASAKGEIDPRVTQKNIDSTICAKGYTAKVRPPVTYTLQVKKKLFAEQDLFGVVTDYILDHKIPLELGGAPTNENNLMLQTKLRSRMKDQRENQYHKLVCEHKVTLKEAQNYFFTHF